MAQNNLLINYILQDSANMLLPPNKVAHLNTLLRLSCSDHLKKPQQNKKATTLHFNEITKYFFNSY